MKKNHLMFACVLVLIAVFARIVPHLSNFSPLLAIALFSGAVFSQNKWYYLLPVVALIASDLFLGFHSLSPVIYFVLAIIAVFGTQLQSFTKKMGLKSNMSLMFKTSISALFFFVTTNLAVFFLTKMYPMNWQGLTECFTLALPFFRNTFVSSLLYSAVLFNVYAAVTSKSAAPVEVTT